jgi:hypothetical protein
MSFHLFQLGAENGRWRQLLLDGGAKSVGMNYVTAASRRKLTAATNYSMLWGFDRVMLCASSPAKRSASDWRALATDYRSFAMAHLNDLEMVIECDAEALGEDWIEQERSRWSTDKLVPVWHWDQGPKVLEGLGLTFPRIALHAMDISRPGGTVLPILKRLQAAGVKMHGLGLSKVDAITNVRLDSCSSTSWLSGSRFGETIWWDGRTLHRYSTRMKDQARRRHRKDFERAGFDLALLEAEDPDEWNRLTLWSWLRYEEAQNGSSPRFKPAVLGHQDEPKRQTDDPVTEQGGEVLATPVPPQRERMLLPIMGFREVVSTDPGTLGETTRLPTVSSTPQRKCSTCFVNEHCPAFSPGALCSYELPLEVRTPEQRRALLDGLVEMQAQRVAFMRFNEELTGGYADPNLSQEFDRLIKTFVAMSEMDDQRDSFRMTVESKGQPGILSRIFGGGGANVPVPPSFVADQEIANRILPGELAS